MTDPGPPTSCRPTNAQVLLGLFIVWQLFFLFAANLLGYLDYKRADLKDARVVEALAPGWTQRQGHVHDAVEIITGLTDRWSHVTGQLQTWSLFAPGVTNLIPFESVVLRWDDDPWSAAGLAPHLSVFAAGNPLEFVTLAAAAGVRRDDPPPPVTLLSSNEPADPRRYFRVGNFRLRKFESYLDVPLYRLPGLTEDEVSIDWRERIEDKVRDEFRAIRAYLRWRSREFRRDHPDRPEPRQVILQVRVYRVPHPDRRPEPWDWQELQSHPVARWRPHADREWGYYGLEMYNPVIRAFETLPER